jgi:AraC-like DNA-binding protein
MLFIIGIALTFFLEFLLLSKKNKSTADIILALWLFFTGVHLFLFYLHFAGLYSQFPALIGVIMPMPLVHGPFLFLYVTNLTNQVPGRRYLQLIHFVPPFLMYLYMIHFFILPASEKSAIIESGGTGYETFSAINFASIVISGIGYVAASQVLLRRYGKRIRQEFSDIEKISLNWLRYNIWGIGAIWGVVLLGNFIFSDQLRKYGFDPDVPIFGTVVLFVCFLGFFGIRQSNVFVAGARPVPASPDLQPAEPSRQKEVEKYAKSGLRDTDAAQLHKKLNEFMKQEKPYLNSSLSLSKLGESMDIHPNYLSQVINERERKNFYDYINGYRIDEFFRLVSDPKKKHFTLLSLAFDSGFNSKSTFNACFKKVTGQTPSEYMRQKKAVSV